MLYTTVSRDQYLGDCLMVSGQTRHDYLAPFNSILSVRFLMHHSRLKVQKLRDQSEVSVWSGYGLGMHWVRSYMAWDIMGVYARCTELVRSGYGLKGGGMTVLV